MRLLVAIPTALGPRTLIVGALDDASARAIEDALTLRGCRCAVTAEGMRFSLGAGYRKRKAGKKRAPAKALAPANVVKLKDRAR